MTPAAPAVAPMPCAHCDAPMIVRPHSSFHPVNACWLSDYELDEHDYPSWNTRTRAEPAEAQMALREAAENIANFAWSSITEIDCSEAADNLNGLLAKLRAALTAAGEPAMTTDAPAIRAACKVMTQGKGGPVGSGDILAERRRQTETEGWTPDGRHLRGRRWIHWKEPS